MTRWLGAALQAAFLLGALIYAWHGGWSPVSTALCGWCAGLTFTAVLDTLAGKAEQP